MQQLRKRAIGLMSGTSADGVDAALIETDGEQVFATGPYAFVEYATEERNQILAKMQEVIAAPDHAARKQCGLEIAPLITERHSEAVEAVMAKANLKPADIDVIGFHGQTLYHDPATQFTLQTGDAKNLAERCGIPVVYDFRQADLDAGGQGAPLVPVYHRALVERSGLSLPIAVVNIGGVANVTYVGREGELLAFDTGPGNVLIDEWVGKKTGKRMDKDGALAAAGTLSKSALEDLSSHPYFQIPPPKSLDRYEFSDAAIEELSVEDGAATLVEFTSMTIAAAINVMPTAPTQWVIVGGGAKNPTLRQRIAHWIEAPVVTGDDLGWQGGYVEAEAFGFLAVRHLYELPLTFPGTTGVASPMTGGTCTAPKGTTKPL